jgi:hypothetical protein
VDAELVAYNLGVVGETSLDVSRRWRKESSQRVAGQTAWQPVFSPGINDPARLDARSWTYHKLRRDLRGPRHRLLRDGCDAGELGGVARRPRPWRRPTGPRAYDEFARVVRDDRLTWLSRRST